MSRSPAHLREVAESLRAAARATTLDFAGLDHHVGPATWEGPAATEARRRAFGLARTATTVCAGLRRAADGLDTEALAIESRARAETIDVESRARAEAIAVDARDRAEARARRQAAAIADVPPWSEAQPGRRSTVFDPFLPAGPVTRGHR